MIKAIEKFDIQQATFNTNYYIFDLKTQINNFIGFSIDFIQMSNTPYQINSTNNILKIGFGGTQTITITPGNYTSTEFKNVLQTALTNINAGFSVNISGNTQLLTITHTTTAFDMLLATSTINNIIGFGSTNLTGLLTYTGTKFFNNSWPGIEIHSNILTEQFKPKTSWKSTFDYLEHIKLDVPTGEMIQWEPNEKKIYKYTSPGSISYFDLYFTDPQGNKILDVHKGIFIIQLIFYEKV